MTTIKRTQNNQNLVSSILDNRNFMDNRDYRNFKKTLMFRQSYFFSYAEEIAYLDFNENGDFVKLKIFGKTAKYGNYLSNTTSKHIGYLINYCKAENIDYEICNNNGTAISTTNGNVNWTNDVNIGQDNCAICLDRGKKMFVKTNCGHLFHKKCLFSWCKSQKANNLQAKCPLCNTHFH
jgi:hypothetical protein